MDPPTANPRHQFSSGAGRPAERSRGAGSSSRVRSPHRGPRAGSRDRPSLSPTRARKESSEESDPLWNPNTDEDETGDKHNDSKPGAVRIAGIDDPGSNDLHDGSDHFSPPPESSLSDLKKDEKFISDFQFGDEMEVLEKKKGGNVDDLPKATLVQDEPEEEVVNLAVATEMVEEEEEEPRRAVWVGAAAAAALLIVVVVIIVVLVLVLGSEDATVIPTFEPTPAPSEPPTDIESEAPTPAPTATPLVFSNKDELEIAVRQYLMDPDSFDVPISRWVVSDVTSFEGLFFAGTDSDSNVVKFNEDLSLWDVSNAENLDFMFNKASVFNQDLSGWNTSKVTSMKFMFYEATAFNQDLSGWDVAKVESFEGMFGKASEFSGDLSQWVTSSATDMKEMFQETGGFDVDLSNWDVQKVTSMAGMFNGASFAGDISTWNTSSVVDMSRIFFRDDQFNVDVSGWDVSRVTDMESAFELTPFDQDLSGWDVSSVRKFARMFARDGSFNQEIAGWNVARATDFTAMFDSASSFDQNLCAWGGKIDTGTQENILVSFMFKESGCPITDDPNLDPSLGSIGPFCADC